MSYAERLSRNVDTVRTIPMPGGSPSSVDPLRDALTRQRESLASAVDRSTATRLAKEAELEQVRVDAEMEELRARVDEMRAARAKPLAAAADGEDRPRADPILTHLLTTMDRNQQQAMAELAETRAKLNEVLISQVAALREQAMTPAAVQSATLSLPQQAEELKTTLDALRTLFPQQEVPADIRSLQEVLALKRIEHEHEFKIAELAERRALNGEERQLRQIEAQIAQQRTTALANTLEKVAPMIAEAFSRFLPGGQQPAGLLEPATPSNGAAQANLAAPAAPPPPQKQTVPCPICTGPVEVIGNQQTSCHSCGAILGVEIEPDEHELARMPDIPNGPVMMPGDEAAFAS